jgi:protein involved in polysaccharide export with SLBB domain
MRKISKKLLILFLMMHITVGVAYAENQRGSDGVRDALENRVKEETLQIALPKDKTLVLGGPEEKEERVLTQQMQLITGDERSEYVVGTGDEIVISFIDRDEINTARYQVSDKGFIFMPLVGRVNVAGIKAYRLEEMLNEAMAVYIQKPNVSILVNATGKIMVVGAVRSPGVYKVAPEMTVMEAILTAGSYDKGNAQLKNVLVMRGTVDKPEVVRLNLKQMIKHGNRRDNITVKPGDMIYVPTSIISNTDEFLARIYRYVVIWYGLGGQDIIEEGDPFLGPFNGDIN